MRRPIHSQVNLPQPTARAAPALRCASTTRKRPTKPSPAKAPRTSPIAPRSEEHTSELQSRGHLVCRLLLEKKKKNDSDTKTQKQMAENRDNTTKFRYGRRARGI